MMTVLPTPAPPKTPTLPPRLNGAIRSMTLMPVSKTCDSVSIWSKAGGWRWIGSICLDLTAPLPSIGWPSTSNTRPSVASPTGTVIGPPVSVASRPRDRPSVVDMATVRTQLLPRCCCTSTTSVSSRALTELLPLPALPPLPSVAAEPRAPLGRLISSAL